MKRLCLLLPLFSSCSKPAPDPIRVQGIIVRPPKDTMRFALPASATRCADGRSLVLESVSAEGNGIAVRIIYGDSLSSGLYPIVIPEDSTATRGAAVAVRYVTRQVAHALAFDSGSVRVMLGRDTLSAYVEGRGLENAIRMPGFAEYSDVPIVPLRMSCRRQ